KLMRALPVAEGNVELVCTVIKTTLESMKVRMTDIIGDASKKQKDIEERVKNLKSAIADFEKEIETRKSEIARLETDHAETSTVRQGRERAKKMQTPKGTANLPASSVTSTPAKPMTAGSTP